MRPKSSMQLGQSRLRKRSSIIKRIGQMTHRIEDDLQTKQKQMFQSDPVYELLKKNAGKARLRKREHPPHLKQFLEKLGKLQVRFCRAFQFFCKMYEEQNMRKRTLRQLVGFCQAVQVLLFRGKQLVPSVSPDTIKEQFQSVYFSDRITHKEQQYYIFLNIYCKSLEQAAQQRSRLKNTVAVDQLHKHFNNFIDSQQQLSTIKLKLNFPNQKKMLEEMFLVRAIDRRRYNFLRSKFEFLQLKCGQIIVDNQHRQNYRNISKLNQIVLQRSQPLFSSLSK